ncbi:unnamed protein product [Ilex paraguariensis]
MGRSPCCSKDGMNRGAWTAKEDKILIEYIKVHGEGKWRNLPKRAGLKRCGKSCRLRWLNYLRPDIKRANITQDEEDLIIRLHKLLGNRWSLIAGRLPGRTDNEIKNYWNTNIGKKVQGHPNNSTNQSKRNPSQSMGQSLFGQPPSPTIGSHVVRTKTSRCTKVFINAEPQETQHLHNKPVVAPLPTVKDTVIDSTAVISDQLSGLPEFIFNEDNNQSDPMMDFEIEKFLSDVLDSELAPVCEFDIGVVKGGDTSSNTTEQCSYSSPNSDQTVVCTEDMLRNSDLGSMATALDPEVDWLQD